MRMEVVILGRLGVSLVVAHRQDGGIQEKHKEAPFFL